MNNKCAEANEVKTQNIFMSKIALTPKGSISATSQEVKDFGAKPEGVGFFSYWHLHQYIIIILILSCQSAFADYPTEGKASYYTIKSCLKEGNSGICANNEPLNDSALTCAMFSHYYIGKKFKVTNIENGKSVICLVTDYGPSAKLFYEKGIIIDLTEKAFSQIADLKLGIIQVKITQVK